MGSPASTPPSPASPRPARDGRHRAEHGQRQHAGLLPAAGGAAEVGIAGRLPVLHRHGATVGGVTVAAVTRIRAPSSRPPRRPRTVPAGRDQQPYRRAERGARQRSPSRGPPGCSRRWTPSTRVGTTWRTTRRTRRRLRRASRAGIAVTDQLHSLATRSARWDQARTALADIVTQVNQAAKDLADVNQRSRRAGRGSAGQRARGPAGSPLPQPRHAHRRRRAPSAGRPGVGLGQRRRAGHGHERAAVHARRRDHLGGAAVPPQIVWGTTAVPVDSGSAAGYLAVLGTDLPSLSSQLDGVATSLRDMVNTVHQTGFRRTGRRPGRSSRARTRPR